MFFLCNFFNIFSDLKIIKYYLNIIKVILICYENKVLTMIEKSINLDFKKLEVHLFEKKNT